MKEVDAAMKAAGLQLELVSISVDPEYDTPVALSAYQKEQGANVPNWNFLTGDYQSIAKTAEEGFKIGVSGKVEKGKPHLGLTHGSHLVLVNETGDIVGYFPSSEPESVERLVQAVRALKAEQ
jgi:protein SCO1/2